MKTSSILKMDWKALGYDAKWEDGMIVWDKVDNDSQHGDS